MASANRYRVVVDATLNNTSITYGLATLGGTGAQAVLNWANALIIHASVRFNVNGFPAYPWGDNDYYLTVPIGIGMESITIASESTANITDYQIMGVLVESR